LESHFTEEMLRLATFKLAAENNAMLRAMLYNQVLIMKKLEMDFDVAPPFPELISEDPLIDHSEYRLALVNAEAIEKAVMKRVWDYAVEHDNSLDIDDIS
jgi:hypothetical protein